MIAPVIRVAAAVIRDDEGRMLLVRKRGTERFMNPGGKYEPGETATQTLVRELFEELGLVVDELSLRHLGSFVTETANEPGHSLESEVFALTGTGPVEPLAEIEEVRWVYPAALGPTPVAPLVLHLIAAGHIG